MSLATELVENVMSEIDTALDLAGELAAHRATCDTPFACVTCDDLYARAAKARNEAHERLRMAV